MRATRRIRWLAALCLVAAGSALAADAPPDSELVETRHEVPRLAAPGAYAMKDGVVAVELSEYAGYAGLVAANNGLEPSEGSYFFKKHGFKLKITLSEEESWSSLNAGRMAASATTVDVLAVYGRQFQVAVPALIGYSRGADGIVVVNAVKRINDLKGRVLATAQFTEADFLIRYLAQEASLEVNMLDSLDQKPDPEKVNLIFCADGFAAGDLFLKDVKAGRGRLAGCVTWAPKTTEVAEGSGGKAYVLATNRNLLVVADILVVNRGFAEASPDVVKGLAEGLIAGNAMVRENRDAHLGVVGKAFGWTAEEARDELSKVHLANLPENLAFFAGSIDSGGSYGQIFAFAEMAYGSGLIPSQTPPERFLQKLHLDAIAKSGLFKDQKASIQPEKTKDRAQFEGDPTLKKDVRFLFQVMSSDLDDKDPANAERLESVKKMLQVSPGSSILLRGHVDNAMVEEFRRQGGEALVRKQAMRAMELSKQRAATIARLLVERWGVDPSRIETIGRGWEEPLGDDRDQNRRVEVFWFTLE